MALPKEKPTAEQVGNKILLMNNTTISERILDTTAFIGVVFEIKN